MTQARNNVNLGISSGGKVVRPGSGEIRKRSPAESPSGFGHGIKERERSQGQRQEFHLRIGKDGVILNQNRSRLMEGQFCREKLSVLDSAYQSLQLPFQGSASLCL